jgi:glycosyltransferase involved in cell wall biosynthesis
MKAPKVSIITPVYNQEKFIGQCIQSVLNQSFPDWEQIIIDDGSTDDSLKIIQEYAKKDSRIQYLSQSHEGIQNLKDSYNKALSRARGELIAILEGDDMWPSNKLTIQVKSFDNPKVVLSWGEGLLINEKGKVIGKMKSCPRDLSVAKNQPIGRALKKLLLWNFCIPTVTVMVRKNSLLEIGGFKQTFGIPCVDYPTWLELALKGEFRFIGTTLGYWRRYSWQSSKKYNTMMLLGHANLITHFYKNLPKDFKEEFEINKREVESVSNFLKGRAFLIKNSWEEARKAFKKTFLNTPNFFLKFNAFLGFLASFVKTNIEEMLEKEERIKTKIREFF